MHGPGRCCTGVLRCASIPDSRIWKLEISSRFSQGRSQSPPKRRSKGRVAPHALRRSAANSAQRFRSSSKAGARSASVDALANRAKREPATLWEKAFSPGGTRSSPARSREQFDKARAESALAAQCYETPDSRRRDPPDSVWGMEQGQLAHSSQPFASTFLK